MKYEAAALTTQPPQLHLIVLFRYICSWENWIEWTVIILVILTNSRVAEFLRLKAKIVRHLCALTTLVAFAQLYMVFVREKIILFQIYNVNKL